LLLHNGGPTVVGPRAGRFDTMGRKVLVAWDDSHGCARAVADALPLLRRAGQVQLRVWRRDGEPGEEAIRARLATVQRWLGWQGVAAEVGLETTELPIGDALLATAVDLGADLIVMGSHGHSGWIERLLGSVTRSALAHSPIPLLMSR
jgi:nucleotide-binding universal stress UspA family protein